MDKVTSRLTVPRKFRFEPRAPATFPFQKSAALAQPPADFDEVGERALIQAANLATCSARIGSHGDEAGISAAGNLFALSGPGIIRVLVLGGPAVEAGGAAAAKKPRGRVAA